MNQTQMLHQMCGGLLSQADIKAICKTRGLPSQAASSRGVLETLFLSDTGLTAALGALEPGECALLHLLSATEQPVDVSFFSRLDEGRAARLRYATFTQRYQGVFAKVKERFVRRGVLLLASRPDGGSKTSQMERWQFALPAQIARHLPPLIQSARQLAGDGDWRCDVARTKLKTAGRPTSGAATKDSLDIVAGELRWDGQPFRAKQMLDWQKRGWEQEVAPKDKGKKDSRGLAPGAAVLQILGSLGPGLWADADALAAPLEFFCGSKTDSSAVCEGGWRWGCLARQQVDGKLWYQVAPQSAGADLPPDRYLEIAADGATLVDLDTVPLEILEQLVAISDQRPHPSRPALLATPTLIKLGRMAGKPQSSPLFDWLQDNSSDFQQAQATFRKRSGKTILHENLSVARVSDLALKVAIQKALGKRIVSLGDEHIAFPNQVLPDVKRIVSRSGYVVKESSDHEA